MGARCRCRPACRDERELPPWIAQLIGAGDRADRAGARRRDTERLRTKGTALPAEPEEIQGAPDPTAAGHPAAGPPAAGPHARPCQLAGALLRRLRLAAVARQIEGARKRRSTEALPRNIGRRVMITPWDGYFFDNPSAFRAARIAGRLESSLR